MNEMSLKLLSLTAVCGGLLLAPGQVAAQIALDSYAINLQPGTNLIANHLDSGGNTLNEVLPVVPIGAQLLKWDELAGVFHIDDYLGPLGGWADSMGLPSTTTLGSREAAFLFNPEMLPYELVITGTPRTPTPAPTLTRGVLHYVSRETKDTALFEDLVCCGNPVDDCSLLLRWSPTTQSWQTNLFTACAWIPSEPVAEIGEGVAIWLPTNPPPPILCPLDITVFGCDPETPVYYRASYGTNRHISCFPPPGTLFTLGTHTVTCFATNDCGDTLSNSFDVTIRPPVAQWPWPSPLPGIGIPIEPVGGATVVYPPAGSSSTGGPAVEIIPDDLLPNSGVRLLTGPADAITFTTVLDFTAPMGAGMDLVLPTSVGNSNNVPILSFRSKGSKGYCVKTNKRFADDPSGQFRCAIVNSNGHLLDPLTFSSAEMLTNDLAVIGFQPGVDSCHVTVELSLIDGSMVIEFDGPVVSSAMRKGWDGCIYGPDRPIKKGQSRLYVGPPPYEGIPPGTELLLYASGLPEVVIEDPSLSSRGRKWSDGHVTLMKAYDDGAERGMQFTPLGPDGGVTVDTGYSSAFDVRLRHFETGDTPTEEQLLTRTIGPIRGLTNRPPPPFLDAMLLKTNTAGGVDCSADFSNLGSPTVLVQIFDHGTLVAERAGVPATLSNVLFTASGWPTRLGKLGGATPCRRGKPPFGAISLPPGGGLPGVVVLGDEFRVLAELAPDAPHPDFYSGFEFIASPGATWAATELQTTSALTPGTVTAIHVPGSLTVTGATEGFRYRGAERVDGPWYDLGELPPTMPTTSAMRIVQPRESPTTSRDRNKK